MIHSNLRVEVQGPYILVAMRGTCLKAKYRKQEAARGGEASAVPEGRYHYPYSPPEPAYGSYAPYRAVLPAPISHLRIEM